LTDSGESINVINIVKTFNTYCPAELLLGSAKGTKFLIQSTYAILTSYKIELTFPNTFTVGAKGCAVKKLEDAATCAHSNGVVTLSSFIIGTYLADTSMEFKLTGIAASKLATGSPIVVRVLTSAGLILSEGTTLYY